MSEEKEEPTVIVPLESSFNKIVDDFLFHDEEVAQIDHNQFEINNTIINISFILNRSMQRTANISRHLTNLLSASIKNDTKVLLKNHKTMKIYLDIYNKLKEIDQKLTNI
jgi:hypothetical protein